LQLRIHIPDIKYEMNEDGDFYKEDTLKFSNEQIDKLINF
jgi:chromate reductase